MNEAATTPQRGPVRQARRRRHAMACAAVAAALTFSMVDRGAAENPWANSHNSWGSSHNAWGDSKNAWGNNKTPWANSQNAWGRAPSPQAGNGWPNAGSGEPSNYGGYVVIPSDPIVALPSMAPNGIDFVDTGAIPDGLASPSTPRRRARIAHSGVPAIGEKRFIADEVLIELTKAANPKAASPEAIAAVLRRHHLSTIAQQSTKLSGNTVYRLRIDNKRSVAASIRALEADAAVASAQPNYLFKADENKAASAGGQKASAAGEAVPEARILTVRTSDAAEHGEQANTFGLLKALDVAVADSEAKESRVVVLGFDGPADPAIRRALAAANAKHRPAAIQTAPQKSPDGGIKTGER